MKRTIAIVAAASLVAASCASSYRPVIDMKGVDEAKFETDLAECRDLAQAEHPADEMVVGAVVLGLLGAVLGALAGAPYHAGTGAAIGGAAGAGAGAITGGVAANSKQSRIVDSCLRGRGYAVLT